MIKNSFSDLEHLELVARRLSEAGIDITRDYQDWIRVTLGIASSLGESGRECYHTICSQYPNYNRKECDEKFDNCLRTGHGDVTLGTVFQMVKDEGVDISLPKGRPAKTPEKREEEQKNRFELIKGWLDERFEFRLNTITEQIEFKTHDNASEWRNVDDRQLDSLLTALHADKVAVSKANLETYIGSEMLAPAYNPIVSYAESLKPWNPRQKDYLDDLFGHLALEEDENTAFLRLMAKKWYVAMVKVAIDQEVTNQIMLILCGEQEGTGKTFFVVSFLPGQLSCYLHHVVELSQRRDKDELLALARNMVCFIDEIQINPTTLNKLKNYVGGGAANAITERTHYGHYAARRKVHASWIATTNDDVFLPDSTGDRRFVVMPVIRRGRDYKTLPRERAFAQAYYLATHPKSFSVEITQEEVAKLKEINHKYVATDLCTSLIPTIIRKPNEGEEAQAVRTGEIINWLTQKAGPNREFNEAKIGKAMKKLGFKPKRTKKGMRYFVVRVTAADLEKENKRLANEEVTQELPF